MQGFLLTRLIWLQGRVHAAEAAVADQLVGIAELLHKSS